MLTLLQLLQAAPHTAGPGWLAVGLLGSKLQSRPVDVGAFFKKPML